MPFTGRRLRRRLGSVLAMAVVTSGLAVGAVVATPAPQAVAAPALSCGSVYAIQGLSPRNIWSVNTGTGGLTSAGTFSIGNASGNLNGLGITDDGSAAYGVLPDNSGNGRQIYRQLRSTDATTAVGAGVAGAPVTHGAVNPANNFYYYGGITNTGGGNGTVSIYGFNTATNTSLGLVAQGTIPAAGGNGDWTFDQAGRLYVTGGLNGSNTLVAINQALPTAPRTTPLAVTGTQIASISTPSDQPVNGVAFGGNGLLYLASQQQLFEVNAGTGAVLNTRTLSVQGASVDLASCARPATVSVVKSFPSGRVDAGDQATVSVSGSNITTTSGTTTGSETGLQDQQPGEAAGPVLGTSGTTYTISESGAGTRASSSTQAGYTRAWSCVNEAAGNAVVASGTGASGTFTMPSAGTTGADVVCTFTNTAQVARVSLDKTAGAPTGSTPGSTITYGFVVTNTGTVPLTGVSVSDPKVGPVTCGTGPLAIGATRTCTPVTYTLTQADINAGRVDNTATATGTATNLPNGTATDSTSTTITQSPSLQLTKRAGTPVDSNGNGIVDAGDRISYTFDVTNNGNLLLTGLSINDAKVGATTCTATVLQVGGSTTCRTTTAYTITAADQTAGAVDNSATAVATGPLGGTVTSNRSTTSTAVTAPNPRLTLDKSAGTPVDANGSGITDVGDTVAYSFLVTNSGNVAVTGLTITDGKVGSTTCPATSLAVGASTTCRTVAPYTVTAADQTAGAVSNSATATASVTGGGSVTSNTSTTRTTVTAPNPSLSITKTAGTPVDVNGSGITDAGDTIGYTFTVRNNGNVPIRSIAVADPLLAGRTPPITVSCALTTLAPAATTTCTASRPYTVTEDDEVAGRVVNTASATGTNPDGGTVRSPDGSATTTVTQPRPSLGLVKRVGTVTDVDGSGLTDAGDTIAYSFTVTNTGNVPVTGLAIADPKLSGVTISCDRTTLAPGAQTTCSTVTPYVVTAADERAGAVTNTARATSSDPDGGGVTSDPSTAQVPTTAQSAVLTLTKSAGDPVDVNGSGLIDAGDTIAYSFRVVNDGNVPVRSMSIIDARAGPVTCVATTLAVGAATTCTANQPYLVTAADETAGRAVNTATASATAPNGSTVTSNASSTTTAPVIAGNPSLAVDKRVTAPVDTNASGLTDAGDTLSFTFVVTNTGNVPVNGIAIEDPLLTGANGPVTCPRTTLGPNQTTTCTAPTYTVTEADERAGSVANTATVRGTDPDGDTVRSAADSTSTAVTTPVTALTVTKTAGTPVDANGSGLVDGGDTIAYTFRVTNGGNVPLSGVTVDDPRLAGTTPPTAVTCDVTRLVPGASTDCAAARPYVVTAADETAGQVRNTATASGTDPDGARTTSPGSSTTTTVVTPAPGLALVKRAGTPVDRNGNGITDAGDTIAYTFDLTNTGDVPLRSLAVTDAKVGAVTCSAGPLGPEASRTCRADAPYVITGADAAAGSVDNTATARADDPDGERVGTLPSSTSTPVATAAPALTLEKTAADPVDVNDSGITDAGDTVSFTFLVTNTGNVPVDLLRIDDPTAGTVSCPVRTLAPGAQVTCSTATPVVLGPDDEAEGSYENSATAVADVRGGGTVTSPGDSTSTPVTTPDPALTLDKEVTGVEDVNGSAITDAGDEITYSFTVSNTGNVPVTGVAIDDPLLGGLDCTPADLDVGEEATCTADPYVVTAADVDSGRVVNVATATATDPDGSAVESAEDSTTTPVVRPAPELTIDKRVTSVDDVDADDITDAGDEITYEFTVTNSGNVPLTGVGVDDPRAGAVTCVDTALDPGDATECTADAPYVVTAADEDALAARNTANAVGTDPDDGDVTSDPDSTSVAVTADAAVLTLAKEAADPVDVNDSGITDTGDTIAYSFTVTNDGNVAVDDIAVVDSRLGAIGVTCDVTTLAPGEDTTCAGVEPYVVTSGDETAGEVVNVATAEGTSRGGDPVESNEDRTTTTPVTAGDPQLSISKRAAPPVDVNDSGLTDAGDTISYTFRVANDGNVPIDGIVVDDPEVGTVTCPQTRLAPGVEVTCTAAPYVVTAADEVGPGGTSPGAVTNTADVTGTDPDGDEVTAASNTVSTPTERPDPELTLDKQVGTPDDTNGSGLVDAGDSVPFTFVVRNTGNVPVTVLEVVDPLVGTVSCENVTIPVDGEFTCVPLVDYRVTAADEAAGSVENTAFARGLDPDDDRVRSEDDSTSTTVDTPAPAIALEKTAGDPVDVNGSGLVDAGDTIAYSFTVTNTGDVPVGVVRVVDPLVGDVTCEDTTLPAAPATGPASSTTCTADDVYTITATDVSAGEVVNTADARADDPDGEPVPAATDTTTTEVDTPDPRLEVEKTAADPVDVNGSGLVDAGDTIAYSFTVTNTGNVPLGDVEVVDPLLDGLSPPTTVTCDDTTLAASGEPGDGTTCTADAPYVVTEADELAGEVVNVARAAGTDPDGGGVTSDASRTTTPVVTPAPEVTVEKSAEITDVNDSGTTDAGDEVTYSFAVTNTGDVPLADPAVSDDLLAGAGIAVTCPAGVIAVDGDPVTCTADAPYVVTEADVTAGVLSNTATVTAADPDGEDVVSDPDTVQEPTTESTPVLTLDKVAADPVDVNGSGITDAGDTIAYTFTVANDGNVPVSAIAIDDPSLSGQVPAADITCDDARLAPDAETTCRTAAGTPYVVTAADEVAGRVLNTATATGTDPDGGDVASNADSATTPVTRQAPLLELDKDAADPVDVNGSGLTDAGDTIAYTFTVSNPGNVPVSDVRVDDPTAGAVTCEATTLAPGASTDCTADAPYVITEADEVAGEVVNTASALAQDPDGDEVASLPDSTTTPVDTPLVELSISKTAGTPVDADDSGQVDAGDTITYTFTVTNDGTVPVSGVAVDDDLLSGLDPAVGVTCDATTLAPAASTDCAADAPYAITEADEATGEVVNTATATGLDPDQEPTRSEPDSTTTPVVTPEPALVLEKSAEVRDVNSSGLTDAGDEIAYSFAVTNEGNVTLRSLRIVDDLLAELDPAITITCEATRLLAGGTTTCVADAPYVITGADEAAGTVDNSATAVAVRPGGDDETSPADDTSTPTSTPDPALGIEKTAADPIDVNESGLVDAGDTIAYSFVVTNTGDVPLRGVGVDDDLLSDLDPAIGVSCEETALPVGASTPCTADSPYVITDADETAGTVDNTARATGSDPDGDPVTSDDDATSTPVDLPDPAVTLEKTADVTDVNDSGLTDAGDTIAYSFTVTNTGDVPLGDLVIDDALLAGSTPPITVSCDVTTLGVDEATTCAADALYVVTEADELSGAVLNEATARTVDPDGEPVTDTDSTRTSTEVPDPELDVEKSVATGGVVDVNDNGVTDAGDTVEFAFTVTNSGNVPVGGVTIEDPLLEGKEITLDCGDDSLAPGGVRTCTASAPYEITAADETDRLVRNTATAAGVDPDGGAVASDPDSVNVPVTAEAAVLTLDKTAADPVDVNDSGLTDAGDTIAYSFTVTNDGNTRVTDLAIDDDRLGGVTCDVVALAPGEATDCTGDAPYVITADDEDAGEVVNTATANGTSPTGAAVVSNEASSRTVPVTAGAPALTVAKTAATPVDVNESGLTDAGDTIAYSFTVTNAGNVPVRAIAIDDDVLAAAGIDVTCEDGRLLPGRSTDCEADAPYVITDADENAGSVDNTATATGIDPDDDGVRSPADATSTPTQVPEIGLEVEKTAGTPVDVNDSGLVDAGDTIPYSFTVTNTGTVPVRAVAVVDPLLEAQDPAIGVACDAATLAPGATTTCAADAPYVVNGVDELTGEVVNSARATGTDPDGDPVSSEPSVTTTEVSLPAPSVTVEKSADVTDSDDSGITDAGDEIAYAFTVTNTGDVPLDDVTVVDPLLDGAGISVSCAATRLAPGAETTCTADAPYVVTQADEDARVVRNTATVGTTDPDGVPVPSDPDTTSTPVTESSPLLTVDKTVTSVVDVNDSGITDAGDEITYAFTVTNDGTVTIRSIAVVDPLLADADPAVTVSCGSGPLAAGAERTCTASGPYVVTTADETAGEVLNSATATGTDPGGEEVRSNTDTTLTPVTVPDRTLSLEKTAADPVDVNGSGLVDAGDTVDYTFAVTNLGNVPVTVLRVDDPLLAEQDPPITVSCSPARIAPDQVSSCTADAPYVVTEADETAGEVVNSATATAVDNDGDAVMSPVATATTDVATPAPALTVEKSAGDPVDTNTSGLVDAGDTIAYSFTVTNTGNVPVTGVGVDDDLLAGVDPAVGVTCADTRLPAAPATGPASSTTCTADAPYVVTEADEAAGQVVNTATAVGSDPDGGDVTSEEDSTRTEVDSPVVELSLTKDAADPVDVNDSGQVDAGDTIAYTFTVTNDGTVPVSDVAVDDDLLSGLDPAIAVVCDDPTLAPDASTDCAAEQPYVITASDVAAGEVVNTATATADDPDGELVESDPASTNTPVVTPDPDLLLEKSADVTDVNDSGLTDAGDEIAYSFVVMNQGNVTLRSLRVVDDLLAEQDPAITITCDVVRLAAGATATCAADAPYVVTAADETTGTVDNVATAAAVEPDGERLESLPDATTTPVTTPAPVVALEKTAADPVDVNGSGLTDAGDTIAYSFTVTNTGNVPLRDLVVDDDVLAAATPPIAVTCEETTLAAAGSAGDSTTCAAGASYVVTEADELSGAVVNEATARTVDPDGDAVTDADSTSTTTVVPDPELTVEKSVAVDGVVDANDNGVTDAGDTVEFDFTVTNSGTVPVTGVSIVDPLLEGQDVTVDCGDAPLAPGDDRSCTASAAYEITAGDETAQVVRNTATAAGVDPDGDAVGSDPDTVNVPVTAEAAVLTLEKSAADPVDVNDSGLTDAGDTIVYSFTVTNDGNTRVSDITIDDDRLDGATCDVVALAPGEATDCGGDAPYVVTADDEDAGEVVNTATAFGTSPTGAGVTSNEASTRSAPITAADPSLTVDKTAGTPADVNDSGLTDAGDTITYSFRVTNGGNVPVRAIGIDDDVLAAAGIDVTCEDGTLLPGRSTDCAADAPYVITEADEAAGSVDNTATATGADPDDDGVRSPADATTTPVQIPEVGLEVEKSAGTPVDLNDSGLVDAGDEITYSFTVTNSGTVPVRSIAVVDPLLDAQDPAVGVTCDASRLAPGATTTCTADTPYVINAADELAGEVVNTARATGLDPDDGRTTSDADSATTDVSLPEPALSVEKSAEVTDIDGSDITDAGDAILYRFLVTNTGDVPLTDVAITDDLLGAQDPELTVTCETTELGPDAETTCTADAQYTVTQADEDAGFVRNTATATGADPDGEPVGSDPDTINTPVSESTAVLTLEKDVADVVDVNDSGITDAGDEISYAFTVTNDGTVTIRDLRIDDDVLAAAGVDVTCEDVVLAAGAETTCTTDGPYVVTEADEDAGEVLNTATAVGRDGTTPVPSNDDTTRTPVVVPDRTLSLVKTAADPVDVNDSGITDAGDTIAYSFTVTNEGNVPVRLLRVDDPLLADQDPPGSVVCTPTRLTPGGTATCTSDAPYVVTEADETAGEVVNRASATALDPDGNPVVSPVATATTSVTVPDPSLALEKSAGDPVDVNDSGLTDAGDEITYTFEVTNTGNVPVTGIGIDDDLLAELDPAVAVTCDATTLAPDASTTCTADGPYVITEADETAGEVVNTATASGVDPDGDAVDSGSDTTTTEVDTPDPALTVEKFAGDPVDVDDSGQVDAGDTIAYRFTVTNDGTVPVSGVGVDDGLLSGLDPAIGVTCDDTRLAPDAVTACTADEAYVITAADVAAGEVVNTATATGQDPDGEPVESEEDSTTTPVVTPDAALLLEKSAAVSDVNESGLTDAGDEIAYTFAVTNDGNVTLRGLEIRDELLAELDPAITVTCEAVRLPAGGETTCAADAPYVITEADEAAGTVDNTATAAALRPGGGEETSAPDATTTPVATPDPQVSLEKTAADPVDVNGSGLTDAGDTIAYSFTVTNTGDVPLGDLVIDDALLAGSTPPIAVTCEATTLAAAGSAGDSTTCVAGASYVVAEADELSGAVVNEATARTVDPDGEPVTDADSTRTATEVPDPELLVEKSVAVGGVVDVNDNGVTDAGDTVEFDFTVTNSGNVPVTDVAIDDPLLDGAGITVECGDGPLAPGDDRTCTASAVYEITTADETAQLVRNTATATGVDPDGGPVGSDPDTVNVPVTAEAAVLTLEKSAADPVDVNDSGLTDAGDTIAYSFTVTNDGNTRVSDIGIADDRLDGVTCDNVSLAPGESTDCTGDAAYVITAADEDAGEVVNLATASGATPTGVEVDSNEDSTRSAPITAGDPSLTIDKTADTPVDVNDSGLTDAGDTIAYSFTVTNGGNVPVRAIGIDDDVLAAAGIDVNCEDGTLLPGRSTGCAADAPYVITEADEAAGSVDNTARATGTDPDGDGVESGTDTTTTPVEAPEVSLEIEKSAGTPVDVNDSGLVDAGDEVTYTFEVTNTGTVPVRAIAVVDPLLDAQEPSVGVTCEATRLAPGATTTCSADAPYVVNAADELAGEVLNTARATGLDPDDDRTTSDADSARTEVSLPEPELSVEKSADVTDVDGSDITDAGDEIAYSFTVTNTGDVPLSDVAISDTLLEDAGIAVTCETTDLAPGEDTTCTAESAYVISQADEDAGLVRNTATATAEDPDGEAVGSDPDTVNTPVSESTAVITLDKTVESVTDVNDSGITDAGDEITYSFTLTNDGTVTIRDLRIDDDVLTDAEVDVTCEDVVLVAGAQTTCTADDPYVVTDADEVAGEVLNTATAVGRDGTTPVPSNEDTTRTPITAPDRVLSLVKTAADPADVNDSGLVDAGDTIAYTFTVTNNGNVPVTAVRVADPLLTGQDPSVTVTCQPLRLAPDATATCTADGPYVITEADEAAGEVVNRATAAGVDADGDAVISPRAATTTAVGSPGPALQLEKTAGTPVDVNDSGLVDAGDEITYTFEVTNTGNVPVTGIGIDDDLLAGLDPAVGVTCDDTRLAPDAATDCAADEPYVITEADEEAGEVVNTAAATGQDPDGGDVASDTDTTTTRVGTPTTGLVMVKNAGAARDVNSSGLIDAGDEITYTFDVENTGTVPVSDLVVDDELLTDAGITVTCDDTTLAPGGTTTCTADEPFLITEADEEAGEVVNTATANGQDPDGDDVTSETVTTRTTVREPSPGLEIDKTASTPDADGDGVVEVGETITYSFTVTNIGDVPLTGVEIEDPRLTGLDPAVGVSCEETTLAAGAATTCTTDAPYVVTSDDVSEGEVRNTATATGTDPDGEPVGANDDSTVTPTGTASPALTLTKTATTTDEDGDGLTGAGDLIDYTFEVRNTGNATITAVAVDDSWLDEQGIGVTCEDTRLVAGASTTCTADVQYVVTRDDEAAGEVVNTARAAGVLGAGGLPVVSPVDTVETPVPEEDAALSIDKRADAPEDVDGDGRIGAGDVITYRFTVTNTGTVEVTDVEVRDRLVEVSCAATTLQPGESTECSADYTLTRADVRAGEVVNRAAAAGTGPAGDVVISDPDRVVSTLPDSGTGPDIDPVDPDNPDNPDTDPPEGGGVAPTSPGGFLPDTGGPSLLLLLLGLLLTVTGILVVRRSRRRRTP